MDHFNLGGRRFFGGERRFFKIQWGIYLRGRVEKLKGEATPRDAMNCTKVRYITYNMLLIE